MFKCRACNSSSVESIIGLGKLPLANALLSSIEQVKEARHNLEVMLCRDCGLAQLRDLVDPKELFSNYVYFSSNSDTMLKSAKELVERIIPTLPKDAYIIEVASNDGYLLKNYINNNINSLGIDPAKNIAKIANDNGIPTLNDFFSEDLATKLASEGKKADIIHANNVFAHVPDIKGFIKGVKLLLKPHGKAVIEVPYFLDLVEKLEFDTIYHEHVFYFSIKPLKKVFERYGLELFDIEETKLHGGTVRLYIGHTDAHNVSSIVTEMIKKEEDANLYNQDTFVKFMNRVNQLKQDLNHLISKLKNNGARIAAYGASAKGTTLLNYFGLDRTHLDFVVDRSPVKQGLFTPGTHIKIMDPSSLVNENISHALLLTWNFADEIRQQQQEFINRGGKFIIPLPEAHVM